MDLLGWLLESDPAIRWQVLRDLTDTSPAVVEAGRERVAKEGLGTKILAEQQPDGAWRRDDAPAWLTTLFTLQLLRATGIDNRHAAVRAAADRLEAGLRWNDQEDGWELRPVETGGNTFFEGEVEPCINGGALAVGAYLGRPVASLADRLISEQLEDGGWNCEAPKSKRSSFHTTICVLEGLVEYERAVGSAPKVAAARRTGEEYLLKRTLFRRLTTGEIAHPAFLQFAFPPRYHYDVLRALDYFRNAGTNMEPRMLDAIQVIREKRSADGRWLLDNAYDEGLAISAGEQVGAPSRWNTLRAMRVLRWAEQ